MKKTEVLFLALEFSQWRRASHLSYSIQLGLEEALKTNGVKVTTVTTPWLSEVKSICRGKCFDQVWLEIVHNNLSISILEWVQTLAPIRLGILGESLDYTEEECFLYENLKKRKKEVQERLCYLTHIISCDEKDVEEINESGQIVAMWFASIAGPKRFIDRHHRCNNKAAAVFVGTAYGRREKLLKDPLLEKLLVHLQFCDGRLYPFLFNRLHMIVELWLAKRFPFRKILYVIYLPILRHLRRRCFAKWLKALQQGCAVVNLPHFVKSYPGRVSDSMAIGVPMISWRVPNRPKNEALFADEKEILFFDEANPDHLVSQIKRVQNDDGLAARLIERARDKVARYHTNEQKVEDILKWIKTGEVPQYE